jgi:hypothetical protein
MGSFSPIQCTAAAAGITLHCFCLVYTSLSWLILYLGGKTASIHNLLPFFLIGIGVENMSIIFTDIYQTNHEALVEDIISEGMLYSDASITIILFSNSLAF